ncbi:pyrroline-5-carboxylate reductase [Neorhizobium petrolearium]|uniref:pyrroline-5-carboxylate reductase n=2 Tax=Neorhizobium petrolearium TaxID=515361 RepID=UPI002D805C9F|nr:pyrroline-5-carboxylate reductase [Neorhizobium petrolearium]
MTDAFCPAHSVLMMGCGNMGAAIAAGVSARMPLIEITAVDHDAARARKLLPPDSPVRVLPSAESLGARAFDVCILAVKPQHVEAALQTAQNNIAGALIISIAAGFPLAQIRARSDQTSRIVRVMPNLPATAASAMSVGHAAPDTISDLDRKVVEALFQAIGRFCWVEQESDIDLATGISGSGPGYVFAFTEHLQRAAERMGFATPVAELLARQTVVGAARLLELDSRGAHELKHAVTSPGGTTQAGLSVLEAENGLAELLMKTTAMAANRATEFAKLYEQEPQRP